MTLPTILAEENVQNAADLLADYYRRRLNGLPAYTGSCFDSWAAIEDADEKSNVITADDLIAVSFLSVNIPGAAAMGILATHQEEISGLLADIPSNKDLADIPASQFEATFGEDSPAFLLWGVLRGHSTGRWGIGETRASKIMARKRPRLIPIYDSVVGPLMGLDKNSKGQ